MHLLLSVSPITERDNGQMGGRDRGRMSDLGPDKTDTDWRARPVNEDDGPPKKEDAFGVCHTLICVFF